jgi:hypothetical protein
VQIADGARRLLRCDGGVLRVREAARLDATPLEAPGACERDAPDEIAAALELEGSAFAWADPIGRRIRMPGSAADWIGL